MSNKYIITQYSYDKAKELGLTIKLSQFTTKKLDVYKNNEYIASIGDSRYFDYPNYIRVYGQIYANERKRLYHIRHKKGIEIVNSKQYLAANILW